MTRACREARTRCTSWDISRAPEPVRAIYDHGPPAEPSVRPAVAPETMLAFALGTRGAHARAGRWPAWRTDGHAGERRRHISGGVAPDFSSIGGRTPGSEPVVPCAKPFWPANPPAVSLPRRGFAAKSEVRALGGGGAGPRWLSTLLLARPCRAGVVPVPRSAQTTPGYLHPVARHGWASTGFRFQHGADCRGH